MKQEPRMIKCPAGCEDGMMAIYEYETGTECWIRCENCDGEGTIPDPDDFENTLSDLVQAKEKTYEQD